MFRDAVPFSQGIALLLLTANLAYALGDIPPPPREPRPRVDVYVNPNSLEGKVPALSLGDPAPPLKVASWIAGKPVASFEKGKVYLVEFWASWCQPCQKSIPELKHVQVEYRNKGLVVIGVAGAETDGPESVRSFVKRQRIDYSIAYVDEEGVYEQWMQGARVSGLPWIFLIDRMGRIAWWGQPFEESFSRRVQELVDGKLSLQVLSAQQAERKRKERQGWDLQSQIRTAMRNKSYDEALTLLDQIIALDSERFWWEVAQKFVVLLENKHQPSEAYAYAQQAVDKVSRNNPHALLTIARAIIRSPESPSRDLRLAAQALDRADELTRGENADVLRALAELHALRRDYPSASRFLEKAAPLVSDSDRDSIKSKLSEYRKLSQNDAR